MYVLGTTTTDLEIWIREEIELHWQLMVGASGKPVRRVQEWLSLGGFGLTIDGIYGPVTAEVVARFQQKESLEETGRIDDQTYQRLVAPMRDVLVPGNTQFDTLGGMPTINDAVLDWANVHLRSHPREIGGENRGPWVRLYMKGKEGPDQRWCAGFVTFVLRQATESLGINMPIQGSASCDALVAQAQAAGRFLSEADARTTWVPAGSIFLVRNSRDDSDWNHAGFVVHANELDFATIEGNTNDAGEREGYEVCARTRGYKNKDFILLV